MVRHGGAFVAGTFVVIALVGGAAVFAQGPGGRGPGGPRAGFALRGLDLTEAQRMQVRQLAGQHREQMQPLLDRARAAQDAQRKAVDAVPFDEQQVRTAAQTLAEAQAEVAVQRARLQNDIYALLTPDQQARMQKMRADREARMKQRMDRLQRRGAPRLRRRA